MPHRLSGMILNRVDLVPDGSNPDANIVLFKSKGAKMPKPTKKTAARRAPAKKSGKADTRKKSKQRGDEEEEDEEDDEHVVKGRRGKAADDDDADDDAVDDDQDELDEEDEEIEKSDDDDDGDVDDEDDAADEDDEEDEDEGKTKKSKKSKKTPAKKSKKPAKRVAKSDDEDDDDLDDLDDDDDVEELDEEVLKSLPASTRRKIEKSQRIAKEALEIAKEERDKRVTLEYVERAKKDIPNLTGTHEEKGGLLKALFSGEPLTRTVAKSVLKLLKTGDAAVRNLLMSETGKSRKELRGDDDSAYSQLCEERDEILKSKEGRSLTKEQAMDKACKDNPDLYRQYQVEKSRSRRRVVDASDND